MNPIARFGILLGGVVVLAGAPGAHAEGGINFAWDDCHPAGGVVNRAFACNSNLGIDAAVGSFRVGDAASFPEFHALEFYVTVEVESAALPDWWQYFNTGSCRQHALGTSGDFSAFFPPTACLDPWVEIPVSGIGAYRTVSTVPPVPGGLPNQAQIIGVMAVATGQPLVQDTEYYGFLLRLSHIKTTGTGACAGCTTPASLRLDRVRVYDAGGFFEDLTVPMQNACITWQGGAPGLCGGATPAQGRTWGQIKGLYR